MPRAASFFTLTCHSLRPLWRFNLAFAIISAEKLIALQGISMPLPGFIERSVAVGLMLRSILFFASICL